MWVTRCRRKGFATAVPRAAVDAPPVAARAPRGIFRAMHPYPTRPAGAALAIAALSARASSPGAQANVAPVAAIRTQPDRLPSRRAEGRGRGGSERIDLRRRRRRARRHGVSRHALGAEAMGAVGRGATFAAPTSAASRGRGAIASSCRVWQRRRRSRSASTQLHALAVATLKGFYYQRTGDPARDEATPVGGRARRVTPTRRCSCIRRPRRRRGPPGRASRRRSAGTTRATTTSTS